MLCFAHTRTVWMEKHERPKIPKSNQQHQQKISFSSIENMRLHEMQRKKECYENHSLSFPVCIHLGNKDWYYECSNEQQQQQRTILSIFIRCISTVLSRERYSYTCYWCLAVYAQNSGKKCLNCCCCCCWCWHSFRSFFHYLLALCNQLWFHIKWCKPIIKWSAEMMHALQ